MFFIKKVIIMNTEYGRACAISRVCSENVIIAQIYDYVGAVYGQPNKVAYDGVLTDQEKQYVETELGRLTQLDQIASFLEQTRTKFLRRIGSQPNPECSR